MQNASWLDLPRPGVCQNTAVKVPVDVKTIRFHIVFVAALSAVVIAAIGSNTVKLKSFVLVVVDEGRIGIGVNRYRR